jgi:putative chitinase
MLNKLHNKIPIQVLNELGDVMKQFNITNSFRLTHFLAQVAHESGNFKHVRENLNYSTEGLLKVFPKYFDKNTAPLYARKPEQIANIVYESRMGNGNRLTGDGWRFRGRGYLQLTGRTNYKAFSDHIGDANIMINPDLVATKYPLTSAAWFFDKKGLWKICDEGVDLATIRKVSQRVNGGFNGISDRVSKTNVLFNILV